MVMDSIVNAVKVKCIHEYKQKLLNILGIVYRYKKMKEMSAAERKAKFVPRVCIFGRKAFATYVQAKRIVKFITDVESTVNRDPEIGDLLKYCWDGGQWNRQHEVCHERLHLGWDLGWGQCGHKARGWKRELSSFRC